MSRDLTIRAVISILASSAALAQVAPANKDDPPAASVAKQNQPAGAEPVVVLSPFEVTSANDRGYYGANTMSGTRLNSSLEDLGASITVVTKKQMEDFALLDLNDIFNHEAGTEGTDTFTDFSFSRNGEAVDNTQLSPDTANRIRGIGSALVTFGSFETSGRTPIDPVDIDAVEISRGPNSSLFGIGSAAGTVNTVPSAAGLFQNKSRITARADTNDGYRGSIDLNRVLKKGVLALRTSAVFQRTGFDLKPSGINTERLNGMLKYQPFKSTTVSARYSYTHAYGNRPNTTPPRDAITPWLEAGSPTWNPVTSRATIGGVSDQARPGSLLNVVGNESLVYVDQTGVVRWTPWRTTTGNAPTTQNGTRLLLAASGDPSGYLASQPLMQKYRPLTSKALYDWSSINLAAPNRTEDKTEIASVLIDQVFWSNKRHSLAGQAGWFRESSERFSFNVIGTASPVATIFMVLQPDVNEFNLDGTRNPNVGRPFINASSPPRSQNPLDRDTYRAQLAYKLDFTGEKNLLHWFGLHEVSAYGEYKDFKAWSRVYRDAMVSNPVWLAPGTTRGTNGAFGGAPFGTTFPRGQYFFYVGDAKGQNVEYPAAGYQPGTYPFSWGNSTTGAFVTEPVTLGSAVSGGGASSNSWTILKTQGAILQSHFLKNRVVTTFGVRKDARYSRSGGNAATLLEPDGITFNESAFNSWATGDWALGEGTTRTSGVVVRPLRWLSLYVNKSDSFQPAGAAVNLYHERLPDPSGTGLDRGVMLKFFDGKLFVRANWYVNKKLNSRDGDISTIGSRLIGLDRQLFNGAPAPHPSTLVNHATEWVRAEATAQGQTLTPTQIDAKVATIMGLPPELLAPWPYANAATTDVTARGKELEVNFNPTTHWTIRMNVTEQQAVNNHIGTDIAQWLAERLKIWPTIIDPTVGRPWFTERYQNSESAADFLASGVRAPLKLALATEGLTRPQIRRYRANMATNLQLAAFSDNRFIKRMNVGGALRWEDKGGIGYYGVTQSPAIITEYDRTRPIYDRDHLYVDLNLAYRTRLFANKVGATLQFNARNVTEGGRLQPINANPDGSIAAYRIVAPRQYIVSASFDL